MKRSTGEVKGEDGRMTDSLHAIEKERIYLFAPAAMIFMKVTFQGIIPADALQSAVGRAAAGQVALCSLVEQRPDGSAFFVPCDPPVPRVLPAAPGETPEAVMRREMRTPFAVERGEWMRHFLAEEDGKSVWLLCCHHMAGDGIALLYFIRDVEAALADGGRTREREPLALCSPGGALPLPIRMGVRALNRQWGKTGRTFGPEDRARMTDAYWASRSLGMAHAVVDAQRLEKLLKACRAQRVTLTAAWLTAVWFLEKGTMDAGIAVSIRPEGLEAMANWATGISVRCAWNGVEFWHAARKIHRRMRRKTGDIRKRDFLLRFLRALSPTLIDASYFAAFDGLENGAARRISAMFGYDGHPKSCSVTNLLRAPLGNGAVERIAFYPPMVPNARLLFGMVTVRGNLEITLQSFAGEKETKALLDAALSRLFQACEP